MNIELSVIIVNYNGLRYLKDCFESLQKTLQGITYEIVVIDNNSPDASCAFILENYPDVVLIQSKENLGFGRGNNAAVAKARGNYLLLINNDTIVLDNLLPVLDIIKHDSSVGAAGINMLNGNKHYLQAAGNFPSPFNLFRIKNMFLMGPEFKSGTFKKERYNVDWLGGSFIIMPKRIYDEIGGFDKDYFMYVEDVDLCKKIADKGYKRIFLPHYSYIHFVGYNNSKDHLIVNGLQTYINKHTNGIYKQLCTMALGVNKTVKWFKKTIRK
ncbi:glycosyltransferase family 2 protein [Flavobacterium zepuense]|uniref:Glycosyltransferase family 2 protein n=1 Tax=Flavobacterium zepuense TaxID=2593302 RepID=A0A552UVF9_9FLAO|nr:glycosyltransferase family 2 protein [Flavobacterium zepuense]TRW22150.1 glycosyltransferase family 2 protein [Flavobacterium zepuense]